MRIGMAGICARYWPFALANGVRNRPGTKLSAAAIMGFTEKQIAVHLEMSAREYADRMGLPLYTQAEEMIEAEKLDCVILCTPQTQHARWVEKLAPLGVDIFVPKTFATTMRDAQRIVTAAKKYKVRIASGPTGRFLPAIAAARKAVDRGIIGAPFSFRVMHHHGTIDSFGPQDWYRDEKEGGPELSLGWYVLDLVLHFMGPKVRDIYAHYDNFTTPDSPFMDCGQMVLTMRSGAIAACNMYFCNRMPYPSWEIEIAGPKGIIRVQQSGPDAGTTESVFFGPKGRTALPLPKRLPHWEVFWADEFRQDKPLSITAANAAWITELSLAARRSSRTGRPIKL
ncbi:Gfo/Idh/MocA family protein [Planctomycetota bacterium]